MTKNMQKFVTVDYAPPRKRVALSRVNDFNEIYQSFEHEQFLAQSSRCEQCGVPFCQDGCPLENNIPDWLLLSTEQRWQEAYYESAKTNDFPEICGRICPQDRLCEGSCVLEVSDHNTVTIGSIESQITEKAWAAGLIKPISPTLELQQSVGIIGSGPAGLAAAAQLRAKGYKITIYERNDRAGGLLIYGIPSFKLEKYIVQRRIKWLEDSNVSFKLNTAVGKDISFSELQDTHDSILIATGVYEPIKLNCPGSQIDNIIPALDFLTIRNRTDLGDKISKNTLAKFNAKDKNVIVIGGGDTAMDCVRTAVRQGAKNVKCMYRRDQNNMPGSKREVLNAQEEGVEFLWLTSPLSFDRQESLEINAERMKLEEIDITGRQKVSPIPQSQHNIKSDLVILALGFNPENIHEILKQKSIELQKWNTIKVQGNSQSTSLEGVYAAGDIVRGASLVVWAIREGRQAAQAIHDYLSNKKNQSS